MRELVVDGSALTVEDVVAVAHGQARASLGADVPRRMETSRSVVVHAKPDDLKTQPSGDAGARIACGVIGWAKTQ